MEYPLYIDGEAQGRILLEQAGLYTVIEAQLPQVREGLVRLWLHGGGETGYLGILQPWSGGMYLRKKLSRRDMERFPKTVEYASNREESPKLGLHNAENPQKEPPQPAACPWPAPVPGEEEELLWYRRSDGSLVSHDGISSLVALPSALGKKAPGAQLRHIEGREYMVFRY